MLKSNKGSKTLDRLNKIKGDLQGLIVNCSKSISPNDLTTLLILQINHLEAQIDEYFEANTESTEIKLIKLEPIELPKVPKLLDNLHKANINYKLTDGKIFIHEFDQINRSIMGINKFKVNNIDDVRLYLNRIIRLKNLLIKTKYNISFNFYNMSAQSRKSQIGGANGSP